MESADDLTQEKYNSAFCKIMGCNQQWEIKREQLIRTIVAMNAGVTDMTRRFFQACPDHEFFLNFSEKEKEFLRGEQ